MNCKFCKFKNRIKSKQFHTEETIAKRFFVTCEKTHRPTQVFNVSVGIYANFKGSH